MTYLNEMFSLEGQHVIVSGGAGAIGLAMSRALLKASAKVSIWTRSQGSLDTALDALKDFDGSIKGTKVDASDEASVVGALIASEKTLGSVTTLINAVGGNVGKSDFVDTDIQQFEEVLRMNLIAGLMVPTKVVAQHWIQNKMKGSIINITSMTSYKPLSGVWGYNAAKAATLNLTEGAATEFAPHGIRVNAIAPGFFVGKQNRDLLIDKETGDYTPRGQAIIAKTPYGRFGDVDELCGATLFLASPKASGFITGVSLPVDGGFLAHNI